MVKIKNPDENLTNGNLSISTEPNARNNNDIDPKRYNDISIILCIIVANGKYFFFIKILEQVVHHIEVYPTFQYPIEINLTRIRICMQQLVTKLARSHKEKVVSFLHSNLSLYIKHFSFLNTKPASCMKKTISISQHSSISQADDLSSPYARVRSPSHGYDKVRNTEHPYAQLKVNDSNGPSTSTAQSSNSVNIESSAENGGSSNRRGSHQSLLDAVDGRQQQVIFFIRHLFLLSN